MSRPLGSNSDSRLLVHNFVVSNAKFIGDPNAKVYSYGSQSNGKTGPVGDNTKGKSEGTEKRDSDHWKSLSADGKKASEMTTKIGASDSVVDHAATTVKVSNSYALVPGLESNATNSNSVASAVADKAQGGEVKLPNAEGRVAVGTSQRDRVKFEEKRQSD